MTSKAAQRVRALLEAAGVEGIPDTLVFKRTRAGYHQRSEGAWSWYCTDADGREFCGSQWALGKLKPGEVDVVDNYGFFDLVPKAGQGLRGFGDALERSQS